MKTIKHVERGLIKRVSDDTARLWCTSPYGWQYASKAEWKAAAPISGGDSIRRLAGEGG